MNKLIKISNTHYIVVSDSPIEDGDYAYFADANPGERIIHVGQINETRKCTTVLLGNKKRLVFLKDLLKITHSTAAIECNGMWSPDGLRLWMCHQIGCCGKVMQHKVANITPLEVRQLIMSERFSIEQIDGALLELSKDLYRFDFKTTFLDLLHMQTGNQWDVEFDGDRNLKFTQKP